MKICNNNLFGRGLIKINISHTKKLNFTIWILHCEDPHVSEHDAGNYMFQYYERIKSITMS